MIPFFQDDPRKPKKPKIDKRLIHLLPPAERLKLRKQQAAIPAVTLPVEHTIYCLPSSRMRRDMQGSKFACPVEAIFSGKGKMLFATVSHDDFDEFTDWLDAYGCSWQEQ
jgi:hypothetical protein